MRPHQTYTEYRQDWSDPGFLRYMQAHAKVEDAMFTPESVIRLAQLAQEPTPTTSPAHAGFVRSTEIPRLILKARAALRKQEAP